MRQFGNSLMHNENFGIKFGADWLILLCSSCSCVCASVPWRLCGGDERLVLHGALYPHLVTV